MEPIQDLLHRIRWDPHFGAGQFSIGYYDRVTDQVVVVALAEIQFESQDHFAFNILDEEGASHHVPLHRIRHVYRNGERIWHRDG